MMNTITLSPRWQDHVIIITGTIGSGKSTVTELFRAHGAFCASADDFARRVVEKGSVGLERVVQLFGESVLKEDGSLNRGELARIIFSDKEKRHLLESILHPLIGELTAKTFQEALEREPNRLLVYECPLFFETELHKTRFRSVIVVTVSPETSIDRITRRDGLTEEAARNRLAAQIPPEEKAARADFVIDNSGSLSDLHSAVHSVLSRLQDQEKLEH